MERINGMDQRIITAQVDRTAGVEQKKVDEAEQVNQVEQTAEQTAPKRAPQKDMYISDGGKDSTPIGLYRVEADENGNKTVKFDDPDKADKVLETNGADKSVPDSKDGKVSEREAPEVKAPSAQVPVQRLKVQRDKLKMQIRQETDPQKAAALKKKLKALEKKIKQAAK